MQQDHHNQKMGCSSGGGSGGTAAGGAGVLNRFLSAPASWLDALLLELEEPPPPPPQQQQPPQQRTPALPPAPPRAQTKRHPEPPTPISSASCDPAGLLDSTFTRHNSCPPEFLARLTSPSSLASDDFFSISDFDDPSSIPDIPSHKRARDLEPTRQQPSQSPATASDVELESLFQDSVPCRVRAKRGCATHPRSIAERVRRTRISDRIRKLQEVVPNMDKQTNTADMLDEAVEYVKALQKQVEAEFYDISHTQTWQDLVEHQKKCKCLDRE